MSSISHFLQKPLDRAFSFVEGSFDWAQKGIRKLDAEYIGSPCFADAMAHQDLIEPRIRPLVLMINRTGHAKTLASCQGHIQYWLGPRMSMRTPYVYINAAPEIYQAIYQRLEYYGAGIDLRYGRVSLGLRMHSSEGVCMFIDLTYEKQWITRKQVDRDIALLSEILDQDTFQKLPNAIGQKVVNDDRGNHEKQ